VSTVVTYTTGVEATEAGRGVCDASVIGADRPGLLLVQGWFPSHSTLSNAVWVS